MKKITETIVVIILVLVGVSLILGGIHDSSSTSNNTQIEVASTKINLEKFNKIEMGMTYNEVVEIIGEDGTIMSEYSSDGYTLKNYYWYAENEICNATICFENGEVIGKNQFGLE